MKLIAADGPFRGEVELPVSKSIANRLQIISALSASSRLGKEGLGEVNIPEDIRVLQQALNSESDVINIGMAGTAMRFLTAYFSVQNGREVMLKGAKRMEQRPVGDLVDALRQLGADIEYAGTEGFPPLRIRGKKLSGGKVEVSAAVSSQFVSALMMIGPMMQNGLELRLKGKVLSRPYMDLTAECMLQTGVEVRFEEDRVSIPKGTYRMLDLKMEADWSAASYFYAMVAAVPGSKLMLKGLKLPSFQGDSILAEWFGKMGVRSAQKQKGVEITSSSVIEFPTQLDFTDHPDLAQTFAFLAATLGRPLTLTGLDNLRLKETDRVQALQTEIRKLGVNVSVEGNTITVSGVISVKQVHINTYDDHRMAMSAAILSARIETEIENPEVVEKSFPLFWKQLGRLGC
jgi:3-phosphoshikimate 1-carboxyvinyltransferase